MDRPVNCSSIMLEHEEHLKEIQIKQAGVAVTHYICIQEELESNLNQVTSD
jgi:hypothetical protein